MLKAFQNLFAALKRPHGLVKTLGHEAFALGILYQQGIDTWPLGKAGCGHIAREKLPWVGFLLIGLAQRGKQLVVRHVTGLPEGAGPYRRAPAGHP